MGRFDFINFDSEESRQMDREIAKELGIELVPNPFKGKKDLSEKDIIDFFGINIFDLKRILTNVMI